jgi:anti-sigma B factor antagonist
MRSAKPARRTVVFELEGRLRGDSECYAFQDEVLDQVLAGDRRVILDFREVGWIDAAGVGILATIYVAVREVDGELILASIPRPVEQVLNIFWFLKGLPHVDSVERVLEPSIRGMITAAAG